MFRCVGLGLFLCVGAKRAVLARDVAGRLIPVLFADDRNGPAWACSDLAADVVLVAASFMLSSPV